MRLLCFGYDPDQFTEYGLRRTHEHGFAFGKPSKPRFVRS
jgi:hypothetical protein